MTWGQANELQFNVSDLRESASKIKDICTDLRDAKTRLRSSLDTLRTDWDSDASAKFFALFDDKWNTRVENYCLMLEDLSNSLNAAAQEYEPLEQQFNRIELAV